MIGRQLNKPFNSYVITQSLLVLIVLAATHLSTELLFVYFAVSIDRIWLSLGLVAFAQLPVAIMYVKNETRNLTPIEGWVLGTVFVAATLIVETVLTMVGGNDLELSQQASAFTEAGNINLLQVAGLGFLIGIIAAAYVFTSILRVAIRNNLNGDDERIGVLSVVPGFRSKTAKDVLRKPKRHVNLAELYRRELIGVNIAIFGLSLGMYGPQVTPLLHISIPISIMFAIVCVANQLARSTSRKRLSERCLTVSVQLLPLTVTSLLLLGALWLYGDYTLHHDTGVGPIGYIQTLFISLFNNDTRVLDILTNLGLVFAVSVAANTLMLLLFSSLIKPLVQGEKEPQLLTPVKKTDSFGEVAPPSIPAFVPACQLNKPKRAGRTTTPRPTRNVILTLG